MRSFFATVFMLVALATHGAVQAQGVYVTPGEKGPVFSDKPQPGAKEVTLPPLNVMPPPRETTVPAPAAPAAGDYAGPATASAYRRFFVAFPENEGSVLANTAVFEVRLAVEPPLQLGEGHAFMVSINGRPVERRFTATEFMIPPEFWGDILPPPNQYMQLDATIVDRDGRVLKDAAPVRFFMRHATIRNHPRPPRPPVPPRVPPTTGSASSPLALPAPEPADGTTIRRFAR